MKHPHLPHLPHIPTVPKWKQRLWWLEDHPWVVVMLYALALLYLLLS